MADEEINTANTLDLTDMAKVDAAVLQHALGAEIILAHWSNGDRKILKGENVLGAIIAGGQARELAVLNLRLANNEQMHVVAAALQLIETGKMDAQAGLSLWSMLATVSPAAPTPGDASAAPQPRSFAAKTATSYPDAATRGRLRLWKQQLARRYRRFEGGYHSHQTRDVIAAFTHKTGTTGRRRAFDKLMRALGPGVSLEGLRLDGSAPLAVWSLLKPRDSVRQNAEGNAAGQDCVTVNYVLAGGIPGPLGDRMGGVAEGLWSLEITDHALGRVLERSQAAEGYGAALAAVVAQAHHNVLQLRTATVLPDNDFSRAPKFLLRAGSGGFICELFAGPDISVGNAPSVHVRAATWIADDMVHDDQVLLVPDGEPGARLIDGWLLPQPLRRIVPSGGAFVLSSWVDGLPDLLAAPKGRA